MGTACGVADFADAQDAVLSGGEEYVSPQHRAQR